MLPFVVNEVVSNEAQASFRFLWTVSYGLSPGHSELSGVVRGRELIARENIGKCVRNVDIDRFLTGKCGLFLGNLGNSWVMSV